MMASSVVVSVNSCLLLACLSSCKGQPLGLSTDNVACLTGLSSLVGHKLPFCLLNPEMVIDCLMPLIFSYCASIL